LSIFNQLKQQQVDDFSKKYNDYYSLVFSVVYTKINNYHDAEDICQEVFIRYYNKIDEINDPRKWIYGTLRNVILEYYTKQKKRDDINVDSILDDIGLGFVNGFEDTRLIIKDALEKLYTNQNEHERIIFELVAMHNFSYTQVCKHLQFSYKKVRYNYERAVQRFINHLQDRGIKNLEDLL